MVACNHILCYTFMAIYNPKGDFMNKTCAVFGHRTIQTSIDLENKLFQTLEDVINKGCAIFYFGGFGMFDELCHKIVSKLKITHTHIKRIFCLSDPRHLKISKRPKWLKSEDYEDFVYLDLEFDWWYQRIYYRNCAIIDKSDIVIFFAEERESSGAYKALKYAKQKKKAIINLFDKANSI